MQDIPDRIFVDKKDRDLFNKLDQEDMLKLKGGRRTRKEQFLFAMAIGFKNDICYPLKTKEGWFNTRDLQPEDEALINAIAVHKAGSVEILSQRAEVYKTAEEYAHGGIKILCDKIKSTPLGTFDKMLEKELHEIHKNLSF